MREIATDTRRAAHSRPGGLMIRRTAAEPQLSIDGRFLSRILLGLALTVVLLGYFRELYVAQFGLETALKDLRHIALDSEHTIASWFSSLALLLAAIFLSLIARLQRNAFNDDWRRWALLAVLFAGMSIDEAVSFHELLIKPLRATFGFDGIFYFAWVVPGLIVVAVLGAFFLPFLLRLPVRHAVRFAGCGLIYVGGALGMEMVSGSLASQFGMQSVSYILAASAEETLEIFGVTLFCCALVGYLHENFPDVSLGLD